MAHPLLERARLAGAPLIDAAAATFLWQGAWPPVLAGDFSQWDTRRPPAWRQLEPLLWSCTMTFPKDAYIEYAFFASTDGNTRLPDALNPHTVSNGMGGVNGYFYMPDAAPTPLAARQRRVRRGKVTRHRVESRWLLANGRRAVWLYSPSVAEPTPLIVVYDGRDYLQRAMLTDIVDNLIAARRIRPVALALVDHGGAARGVEYSCSEATLGFVVDLVLPLARTELNLLNPAEAPGAHGVMGASAGGRMALFTGLMLPDLFGHVLSQSGAFGSPERESVSFALVRHRPPPPLKIWMDCGRYERLAEINRRMYGALVERGYQAIYREYSGGHNYPAWRNDIPLGLEALYAPPPMRSGESTPQDS